MRPLALAAVLAVLAFAPTASAWTWPADGAVLQPFLFDPAHPYAAGQHRGIDVGGSAGSTVRAPSAGVVTFAGTVPSSGRSLTVETASGLAVTLTHLGTIGVAKGAAVEEGDPVATIGPSGDAEVAAPYVHLGVRVAAEAQAYRDPLSFLPPRSAMPQPPSAQPASPQTVPAPTASTLPVSIPPPVPQPASAQPVAAQPATAQSSATQSSAAQPSATQPSTIQPASAQPASAQPAPAQPAAARSGPAQPARVGSRAPAPPAAAAPPVTALDLTSPPAATAPSRAGHEPVHARRHPVESADAVPPAAPAGAAQRSTGDAHRPAVRARVPQREPTPSAAAQRPAGTTASASGVARPAAAGRQHRPRPSPDATQAASVAAAAAHARRSAEPPPVAPGTSRPHAPSAATARSADSHRVPVRAAGHRTVRLLATVLIAALLLTGLLRAATVLRR